MVVFTCDTCGESLRKKDVEKHAQYMCRCAFITCVDCSKPFYGDEYIAHTKCISDEQFKYGLVKAPTEEKGLVKQNAWLNNIDILLSDRTLDSRLKPILIEMKRFENVPRKKKPFLNWTKCTMKRFNPRQVEECFDKLQAIHQQNQKNQQNGNSNGNANNQGKQENGSEEEKMDVEKEEETPVKKSKKEKTSDENEDASNGKAGDSEDEEPKALEKFKIKKHVAEVLSSKGGKPVKLKRLKKKLVCAYNEYAQQRKEKAKVWSPEDVYSKLNKVLTNKKLFKVQAEIVELTEAGKAKYGLTPAADGDSD